MVLAVRTIEIYSTGKTVTVHIISEVVGQVPFSFLSSCPYLYRHASFPVAFFSFPFFLLYFFFNSSLSLLPLLSVFFL